MTGVSVFRFFAALKTSYPLRSGMRTSEITRSKLMFLLFISFRESIAEVPSVQTSTEQPLCSSTAQMVCRIIGSSSATRTCLPLRTGSSSSW